MRCTEGRALNCCLSSGKYRPRTHKRLISLLSLVQQVWLQPCCISQTQAQLCQTHL